DDCRKLKRPIRRDWSWRFGRRSNDDDNQRRSIMGVDIYLMSVWEQWEQANPGWNRWGDEPFATADELKSAVEAVFDKASSSGGYFRNGYNAGDVMWAMGLSWDYVHEMFDAERRLPIDRARELISIIEARPLTRECVAKHFF